MLLHARTWRRAALALAALVALGPDVAGAQTRIEKVEGKSLVGAAYARLRSLTYQQCEERCLRDQQCIAFEHYRGGGVIRRSSNCALFSSTRGARDSQYSDIGYKRGATAGAPVQPGGEGRAARGAAPKAEPKRTESAAVPEQVERAERERREAEARARLDAERKRAAEAAESSRRSAEAEAQRRQAAAAAAAAEAARKAEADRRRVAEDAARRQAEDAAKRQAEAAAAAAATARKADDERRLGELRRMEAPREFARPPSPVTVPTPAPSTRGVTPVAPGERPPPAPPVTAAQPPPAAAPRAPETATTRGAAPPATGPATAAGAAPPPDFHIVPVFYGTDRNRSDTAKRIAYGNDRAKRLEMGRALISVPSEHKVPNIERPRAWTIPIIGTIWQEAEDPRRHFTVRDIKALSKADLLALIKQRLAGSEAFQNQSLVFIHGYNVGFDDALYRTAQISFDLQFDGATYSYSWPAGSGWTSYPYARDSAQQAEPFLYQFLQMVQNETGTQSINIVAHSMGNQMLLQVLRSLKQRSPAIATINQIILAAPDVDRDAFEFLAGEIRGVARGVTLYAAGNDVALQSSRLFAGNQFRAGDVGPDGPVVVPGIDSIDISSVSTGYLALNHSNYAEHTELLTDLRQLIRTGTRPPELRINSYRRVEVPQGIYWRYGN